MKNGPVSNTQQAEEANRVASGEYGAVLVTRGKHKGKVGYYDDDEDRGQAVVYFDEPFLGDYFLIYRRWLKHADVTHDGLEKFKRDYPEIAAAIL